MDTVVRVDEPDFSAWRPAFEPINHSQFHKIAIAIDDLPAVAPAGLAANLRAWIRPFTKDHALTQRHSARA